MSCREPRPSARCASTCAAAPATSRVSTTWPGECASGVQNWCAVTGSTARWRRFGQLLDRAVLEERKHLVRDVDMDDDARSFAEMRLENLPPGTAAAVNDLSDYEWRSPSARADYERIKELLGRELLDQRFAGMKNALESATDADRQAIRDMLGDLNDLLEKRRLGEDTAEDFDEFMRKHGEQFPENPQNLDELLDALAERSAAAQRMLNSMTPEQREELMSLAAQAFGSPELMQSLVTARRQPALAQTRRGLGRLGILLGRRADRSR